MPKRASVIRVDASSVQGEGAWVEFRTFTWGEMKDLSERMKTIAATNEAYAAEMERLVLERIVAWNWADDQGIPIPVPQSPDDLNSLTSNEIKFLSDVMGDMISGSVTKKN